MRYFVTLFFVFFIAFTIILVAGVMQPKFASDMLLLVDFVGITEEGQYEKNRREAIDALPINHKKREILINHQVFFGATGDMVKLALGEPIKTGVKPADETTAERVVWVYHLAGDNRPTIMEFENGLLVDAKKASTIDVEGAQ